VASVRNRKTIRSAVRESEEKAQKVEEFFTTVARQGSDGCRSGLLLLLSYLHQF
jgi:hypothetical protein